MEFLCIFFLTREMLQIFNKSFAELGISSSTILIFKLSQLGWVAKIKKEKARGGIEKWSTVT